MTVGTETVVAGRSDTVAPLPLPHQPEIHTEESKPLNTKAIRRADGHPVARQISLEKVLPKFIGSAFFRNSRLPSITVVQIFGTITRLSDRFNAEHRL